MMNTLAEAVSQAVARAYHFYHWCNSFGDPRTDNWPLMRSPFPTLNILAAYLLIVKYGPVFMKKRKSYDLRLPLVFYNLSVTALNAWMAYELLYCGLKRSYNFVCQLVDTSDNEFEVRIARAIWWYYMSKLIEFMDTIFFILRKKTSQLTFLHIYHHSTMFLFWWVGARFVPGGCALSGAMVNCFVHVAMYSYYALTAMGPKIQKYLWWKKYLTILQLVQFTTGVVLGLNAILTGCPFTRWMQYVFVGYAFSFILLFGNFYRKSYSNNNEDGSGSSSSSSSSRSRSGRHIIKPPPLHIRKTQVHGHKSGKGKTD